MKIVYYSMKGSAGKTPLAIDLALERGWPIATNEPYNMLDRVIPEDALIEVRGDEVFPNFNKEANVIFDLGGFIAGAEKSIKSALMQADLLIVPIYNEDKAIGRGLATILEAKEYCSNILIIATKLEKQRGEVFADWSQSKDFTEIQTAVYENVGEIKMFPVKKSKAFDAVFEHEVAVSDLVKANPLSAYSFRDVIKQLEAYKKYMDENYG